MVLNPFQDLLWNPLRNQLLLKMHSTGEPNLGAPLSPTLSFLVGSCCNMKGGVLSLAVFGEWPMEDICRLRAVSRAWIQTKQEKGSNVLKGISYKTEK